MAYGEHAVSRTQVFRWHKAFLDGRESVEDEPHSGRPCNQNGRKCDQSEGSREVWSTSDRMISSVLRSLNDSEKGFTVSGQRWRTLGCYTTTMLPVTLPPPWTNFWPKKVFQWFRSHHTRLIRVRVTSSFSQNSNSTSKVVILKLWTTSKNRDRPADGTSTWRLPALLPAVGVTSPAVCGFPRELLWRG